jgi:16S rRNA (cytosine967-C5)-methyltransferase
MAPPRQVADLFPVFDAAHHDRSPRMTDEARATLTGLAAILDGAPAARVVADTLRALGADPAVGDGAPIDGLTRARVARRLLGCCVLRARLAFLAGDDAPSAILAAYVATEEEGIALDEVAWPDDPLERVAVERSCPRWLVEDLAGSLGPAATDAFLAASNRPGPKTLRTNTIKTTRARLIRALASEGIAARENTVAPHAVDVVDAPGRPANLFGAHAWRTGLFEVQDAASQLCTVACRVRPTDAVVDLCAGRGGKTLALAPAIGPAGALWASDVDEQALKDLLGRARRAGANVRIGTPAPESADVVLADVPCSSLGPLRRSPDLRWRLASTALERLPAQQRSILEQAATLVRAGGRLVYATCTVRRQENEEVVEAFLADGGGRRFELTEARQLLPHVEGCDGFFWAVLERRRR